MEAANQAALSSIPQLAEGGVSLSSVSSFFDEHVNESRALLMTLTKYFPLPKRVEVFFCIHNI